MSWIDDLEALEKAATAAPWEFRAGNDQNGDSCDLLIAEIGRASGDEDEEYGEVLFGSEFSAAELSANWEMVKALRNAAPRLLRIARAAKRLDILQRDSTLYSREHLPEVWAELRAALEDGEGTAPGGKV